MTGCLFAANIFFEGLLSLSFYRLLNINNNTDFIETLHDIMTSEDQDSCAREIPSLLLISGDILNPMRVIGEIAIVIFENNNLHQIDASNLANAAFLNSKCQIHAQ